MHIGLTLLFCFLSLEQAAHATSQLKALKVNSKEVSDSISAQKTTTRRALDEIEKR